MRVGKVHLTDWKSFAETEDLSLGRINVIIGPNNGGKSALLRAIDIFQGGKYSDKDVRIGASSSQILLELHEIDAERHFDGTAIGARTSQEVRPENRWGVLKTVVYAGGGRATEFKVRGKSDPLGVNSLIPRNRPRNFIFTYFSKRKVTGFDHVVNLTKAREIREDLRNIVSKVDELADVNHLKHAEYASLCEAVIGFSVSAIMVDEGKHAGVTIGMNDRITIDAMGEGVTNQLGLIVDLCMADNNLFLIEELENDMHPKGLKALLDAIIEKSKNNQFILTTHSNMVTKYLGAAPDSKIFEVGFSFPAGQLPSSTIREVPATPEARIAVLRDLGYDLYDFDLWSGWLILEESTAEAIITKYLAPWFAPRLTAVRTVSAGGADRVTPTFEDFRRLFLFAHLESHYRNRAWVIVDGDARGREVVVRLHAKYPSWPTEHFRALSKTNFELYYPAKYQEKVTEVLSMPHGRAKQEAKKGLCLEVQAWCKAEPEQAKAEFAESAAEVVATLREIEAVIAAAPPTIS